MALVLGPLKKIATSLRYLFLKSKFQNKLMTTQPQSFSSYFKYVLFQFICWEHLTFSPHFDALIGQKGYIEIKSDLE